MRRISQIAHLALPKRPICYSWKGIYPASEPRDTACFKLETDLRVQNYRTKAAEMIAEIKRLQTKISEATQLLHSYTFCKTPQEIDMLSKDITHLSYQKLQYQKKLSDSFKEMCESRFELIKSARAGIVTLLPEDLIGSPFEGKEVLTLSKSDINNLQAWSCRLVIHFGGSKEAFNTLANCIEQGAKIELIDLEPSSRYLIDMGFIPDLEQHLVAQLREKAQSFQTKHRP